VTAFGLPSEQEEPTNLHLLQRQAPGAATISEDMLPDTGGLNNGIALSSA